MVLNDNHSPMMLLTINLECRLIISLFYVSQPVLRIDGHGKDSRRVDPHSDRRHAVILPEGEESATQ